MRQTLSWFLSILFHVFVALVLFHAVDMAPLSPEDIMEVDLTQVEAPESEVIAQLPKPQPVPEPVSESLEPEVPIASAPLPMDKTIVLDDTPPSPEPAPEAVPEIAFEPDVIEISPNKTLPPEEVRKDIVDVRKDVTAHRGAEARFGRAMMGDYFSYSSKEFSGQFRTRDDRVISIIDARNTKYGRFLLYDSKNKTLRRLKQAMGKYVYTVGPSLYEDEPVAGTVTFLAMNDRIERFILVTDDDRLAHYPRKVHVREDDVSFAGADGELIGRTTLPPSGEGHVGVVFAYGNLCVDPGMVQGVTRDLSMHELASIVFVPRGCEEESVAPSGSVADYVADLDAAARYFATQSQMKGGRIGIWSSGGGLAASVRAASAPGQTSIGFLIGLVDDSVQPDDIPSRTELAQLKVPSLWLVTGRDMARRKPFISVLEGLRDKDKLPLTIVIAPTKTGVAHDGGDDQSAWVEQVAADHARLAESWIQSLTR